MSWKLTFLAAVAIVAVAGVAVAAKGGGSKDLTLCAAKQGGALSLAPKSGKCAKGTKKLVIAKEGPQGIPGPSGPAGAAGTTASIQPEPVHFVGPRSGTCSANPGTFCTTWINSAGWGPVGFQKDAAGYVHLQGGAGLGGEGQTGAVIFYLPPGYRPSLKTQVAATECDGTPISVLIGVDGSLDPDSSLSCAILDGISFRP